MKRFTLVALATLISASSVVAFSSSVKAETHEEYCRHHDCRRDDRYERDHAREEYCRHHDCRRDDRYEREHARNERQRERYYDREAHEWRYR